MLVIGILAGLVTYMRLSKANEPKKFTVDELTITLENGFTESKGDWYVQFSTNEEAVIVYEYTGEDFDKIKIMLMHICLKIFRINQ